MATATTSISSLPTSAQVPTMQNSENIRLETKEKNIQIPNTLAAINASRNADTNVNVQQGPLNSYKQAQSQNASLVSGIQKAARQGTLQLSSRDIPTNQQHIVSDPSTRSNYVPPVAQQTDYIADEAEMNINIKQPVQTTQSNELIPKNMLEELQAPILAATIYFIFQQPLVQKRFLKLAKGMLGEDGQPTTAGYLSSALAFSSIYFGATKLIDHFII